MTSHTCLLSFDLRRTCWLNAFKDFNSAEKTVVNAKIYRYYNPFYYVLIYTLASEENTIQSQKCLFFKDMYFLHRNVFFFIKMYFLHNNFFLRRCLVFIKKNVYSLLPVENICNNFHFGLLSVKTNFCSYLQDKSYKRNSILYKNWKHWFLQILFSVFSYTTPDSSRTERFDTYVDPRVKDGHALNRYQGRVSWTSPEGIPFTLDYSADGGGFHPQANHLPDSPNHRSYFVIGLKA